MHNVSFDPVTFSREAVASNSPYDTIVKLMPLQVSSSALVKIHSLVFPYCPDYLSTTLFSLRNVKNHCALVSCSDESNNRKQPSGYGIVTQIVTEQHDL